MTATTNTFSRLSVAVLTWSAVVWWFTAIFSQLAFFYYIAALYDAPTLTGDFHGWTRNHLLAKGYVPGDSAGNLAFAAHTLCASYVALGGAVQFVTWIRTYLPAFHRWNGRLFLLTALGASVTGLYGVWVRGANPSMVGSVSSSLNAALIILFAAMAWRFAHKRDFAVHRRWALRTYFVANGQWLFRVGLFAWIIVNRGPVGIGKHFDGPFVLFWDFGCYLVPLTVAEIYLRAKQGTNPYIHRAMSGGLFVLAALIAIGTIGIYVVMWRPFIVRS